MAIPDVDIPVTAVRVPMEWIMTAERAVEKVHERLLRTCRALEGAGVPYVVIGGNAVAVWVGSVNSAAVRNTKDVDILLRRQDLWRANAAMREAGFVPDEVHGVTMFLDKSDPMPSRGVHVVIAGERIRPEYQYPAPEIMNVKESPEGVRAIGLVELLVMKLQAYRSLDRVHIRDLMKVGLITDEVADQIPADLRVRLDEILANPDG